MRSATVFPTWRSSPCPQRLSVFQQPDLLCLLRENIPGRKLGRRLNFPETAAGRFSISGQAETRPSTQPRHAIISRLPEIAISFAAGMFGWSVLQLVVGNPLGLGWWEHVGPLVGLSAAVVWLSRWRGLIWAVALLLAVAYLVVSYSPVARMGIRSLVQRDPLEKVDAVVVLSSSLTRDGELSESHLERVLHGFELVHAGYGPKLVITRLTPFYGSSFPAVQRQKSALGLNFPVLETPGEVVNTHDEALEIAKMMKTYGWRRVALVTHPLHMRRAAAVFEKAGVRVLRTPCRERDFMEDDPRGPVERQKAFQQWLHEWVGFQVYRCRGWI